MGKIGYIMPPLGIWGPWVVLSGTATISQNGEDHKLKISTNLISDAGLPQGEVEYVAPRGIKKTSSFLDEIEITRDGKSLDEVKVRFKNLGLPLGAVIEVTY